ncbi:hypothetical protein GCM10008959_36980 [Deinococcus seoulensis]|uniref:Metallo-beta-lactamase domain-containing protein n=1 Tax=Deinococcus seoulensis TaxID=1837379 RepID=A0ABQ2S069_9DEIO|nr:ComEC/Rec2 family competence protein [Deinococcus seoulensis]GGR71990.1 hypothetical protein GCM10008959_36980 [Deinococcus seoulensis]
MSPSTPRKPGSEQPEKKTRPGKATPATKAASAKASDAKGSGARASSARSGSTKASNTKASGAKASASGAKAGARTGRRAGKGRPGTSSSDLLGLLVLIVTGSLAACGWIRNQGGSDAPGGPVTTAPDGAQVTIRFLDVGQGDAILIRSPEGKTALIDGGRSAARLTDALKQYGVTRLDLMIATHADADHIAGLVPAAALNPRVFINNGLGGTTQTWERLVAALQDVNATFVKASNQTVNLGSVKLRVLAPPPGMPDEQNTNSVGLAVQFGEFRALMTGDSETPETEGWLAQERADVRGPFQVYKSIHHGASNGDSAAWLASVRPQNVVISVGQNSYGHPTDAALRLYRQSGARVYRTDRQGTVTFQGRADGTYTAETER